MARVVEETRAIGYDLLLYLFGEFLEDDILPF
jgi:hypothetical protein